MVTFHWFTSCTLLILTAIYCFHKYMSRNYDYWKKRNIYYIKPLPIFGNFFNLLLFRTTIGQYLAKLYNQTKEPVFGIFVFDKPYLILRDPEVIKSVLIQNFNYFNDRSILASPYDPFTAHMLFFAKNPEWKLNRGKMTPVFSSKKLRNFIPDIKIIGNNAVKYIEKINRNKSIEAKEICSKYSTDVLVKCGFGLDAQSFANDNAVYCRLGQTAYNFTWSLAIQQISYFFLPNLAKLFGMKMFGNEIEALLRKVFWNAISQKEKNKTKGHDLIDILIDVRRQNKESGEQLGFADEEIFTEIAEFFIAGFETPSLTMAFTLYELCLAPEIQTRLRHEIKTVLKLHDELTYEVIKDMKFLDMVVRETLRKYPVFPFLDRECNTDYKIPGTNITIEKGMPVYIPMFGLHYDPEYFPDPEVFDPDRFSPENISSIPSCTYLPFGEGPRQCLGKRFGLITAKIGLITILSEFEVKRSIDTPVPLRIVPKSLVLTSDVGLPMTFRKDVLITA